MRMSRERVREMLYVNGRKVIFEKTHLRQLLLLNYRMMKVSSNVDSEQLSANDVRTLDILSQRC